MSLAFAAAAATAADVNKTTLLLLRAIKAGKVIGKRNERQTSGWRGTPPHLSTRRAAAHTEAPHCHASAAFEAEVAGLRHDSQIPELGRSIGEALLEPHRSYLPLVQPLLKEKLAKGMAHITGGGITDNLPRVLPTGTHAAVNRSAWTPSPIFTWLQATGAVPHDDMYRTFNMGIGLIVVCAEPDEQRVIDILDEHGTLMLVKEIASFRSGRWSWRVDAQRLSHKQYQDWQI